MTSPLSAPRRPSTGVGIALVVAGYLVSSVSDSAVKWVAGGYPVVEVLFFSALFSLVPMVAATLFCGGARALATRRLPVHLIRGTLAFGGYLCGYYAIGHMPLADFYAAVFTAPLFITALSATIAKEPVDLPRWLAVATGFAGILVMVQPGSGSHGMGAGTIAALVGSFLYALSVLLVRRFGGTESAAAFGVYGTLVAVAGSGALLPAVLVPPLVSDLPLFALAGFGMGTALLCIFAAFRRAPAAVLAPFQYTQMIWGVLVGLLMFGERPDSAVVAGSVLVIGSGLYILYRETRCRPIDPCLAAGPAAVRDGAV